MSAGSQAIITARHRAGDRACLDHAEVFDRATVGLIGFAALGLYGVLRWATLLTPLPLWRLLAQLALAVAIAGTGARIASRSRGALIICTAAAVPVMLGLSGIRLAWMLQLRVAATVNGVGEGLSALPRVLVPYTGINEWIRTVVLLGAGVLLLSAALVLAFAPRHRSDLRRGLAALPLLVLAVVPSTLARPQLPYLHGVLLFALLSAFVWGQRIHISERAGAFVLTGLAAGAAMLAAPLLDAHHPWLDYQALAGRLVPSQIETFDWTQRYGPLHWPRTGHEVLDVSAATADYWKAENLDAFDGQGWVSGNVEAGESLAGLDPGSVKRWSETLHVTVRAMSTSDVIGAGSASAPTHLAGTVLPGVSPGTWTTSAQIGPGDSYLIRAYSPRPTPGELAGLGRGYPAGVLPGYLSLAIPAASPTPQQPTRLPAQQIIVAPFGSPESVLGGAASIAPASAVAASVYAPAFALARRLERRASTPYAYVMSVERYLANGFRYDENPPLSRYPIETFLFKDKAGYCQQFAGAMALLLRMGGIPARVATGFTSGNYNPTTHEWVVSDIDAHAWVEVWFPRYGWVRFDPTPTAAPARGGRSSAPLDGKLSNPGRSGQLKRRDRSTTPSPSARTRRARPVASETPLVAIAAIVLISALLLTVAMRFLYWGSVRRPPTSPAELVDELERALARCGRPLARGVTLASLEHRFRSSPDAAAYVRALRLARFADLPESASSAQRRAVRAQLRIGLGLTGRLRALWALPPRL